MEDQIKSKNLFLSLPMPFILTDLSGKILEANPEFIRILNFSEKEIIGKKISELSDEERIKEIFEETLEKGLIRNKEINLLNKEKKPILMSLSGAVKKGRNEKEGSYFFGFFDLSKQKENEIALLGMLKDKEKERKQAFQYREGATTIIDNLNDAIFLFNDKNGLLFINALAEEMLGVQAKDIIGKSIDGLSNIALFKSLRDFLKEENKIDKKEISFKETLILEVSITPLTLESGDKGTLVILRDITREKFIERMKSEFVSLSAHQLRTPLSAIKWSLRMLLDGDFGKFTAEQREFLEKTYRSNERMINLINDLLNATRIEEGRYLYRTFYVDFLEIVESAMAFFKTEIKKKNINFEFQRPKEEIPKIKADREKLQLAVQNLIDNAIKYTQAEGKVTIFLTRDKNKIEFKIQDTGMGIREYQQRRVFTKFFRGSNAIRKETEGSGLGLFLAKNIIKAHGGEIGFQSKEGEGSVFYFTLPLKSSKIT